MMTAAIVVSSCVGYLLVGGVVWTLMPERWDGETRDLGAMLWPAFIAGLIAYQIAMIGPRAAERIRNRIRLPKAQVRK